MTSYKVGQLSALISNSSSVSGKQKNKAKKLQLLFSTPLPNHKENIDKSEKEKTVENKQFNVSISPIEKDKKKVTKKHKNAVVQTSQSKTTLKEKKSLFIIADTEVSRDGTRENENHLRKDICTSENITDIKENVIRTKKRKREDSESSKEIIKINDTKNSRTVFVGNLPTSFDKEELKHMFKQFGKVESTRIRSAAAPKASMPKKVAVIKQRYHPDVRCFNGFVVFETKEMAHAALELNGAEIEGHHLRVDIADRNQEHDHRRSLFVGNLPFDIQDDDDLWDFFQECGDIEQVRIIRDKETRIGKGFGYISFKTMDAAALALEKNGEKLNGRPLRISRSMKRERKLPKGKFSVETRKKLHANKAYQGKRAKDRIRLKKNKKIAKNRIRLKKKKIMAQKIQSCFIKESGR